MEGAVIIIDEKDNVAVALRDIQEGSTVALPGGGQLEVVTDIPYSHKVALADLSAGATVIKYGETIGQASKDIRKGEWVHTHNLKTAEVMQ